MPFVDFSDSELMRNKLVEIAWYTIELGRVSEWTPAKDQSKGPSNNLTIETVILCNTDTGDTQYAGIPVEIMFNDKPNAKGFIEGFLRALGVDVTAGRYELKAAEGQKINAFIEHNTWEGRTRNRINHKYRPYEAKESVTT